MKLFAIYVGGEHPKANIEVHDVRFVVAPSIGDTYGQLRSEWWGKRGTLHIDCWAELTHVDGYDVTLAAEPSSRREKLYFVNLGGYDGHEFAERHRNAFVVANSTSGAKATALRAVAGWRDAHRDDLYEAEHAFALHTRIGDQLHIHLEPALREHQPTFVCRYIPLK